MAGTRTRGTSRTTAAKVANLAALVQYECTNLLVLYRKRENLPEDVASDRLVFVSPPSSQLDTRSKLLSLHSALDKCHSLLERAIALEKEDLGGDETGEYENGRRRLKDQLLNLLRSTEELLKAAGGQTVRSLDGSEPYRPSNVFHQKLWVYSVFTEVKLWSETAVAVLQELQSDAAKEPSKRSKRSTRSTRR
uniref:Ciliary neurotrophic factor n=1 Tax=Poecilia latipinna TaxID=48699 RepID=A0A3B3TKL7_9TELE